jgi:nitrate reductase NapE component
LAALGIKHGKGIKTMNVLGFVAFAGGFGFVMWTLSRLMVDGNNSPSS